MSACRHDNESGEYVTADGEPCTVDEYGDPTHHCTARRTCAQHIGAGELTCARCIGRVRTTLRRIPALAALMPVVALEGGVNSEAASLAGPAADPEAWSWRKIAARQGGSWHLSLVEEDDEHHPYTVLTRWALMIAEDYGHDLPERLTVVNAAEYLDRQLGRIAQDPEQDLALLGRELRRCRQHLEVVVSLADHRERGVPCPICVQNEDGAPRLVRVYPHHCEDAYCTRPHYETDEADRWVCPKDRSHEWTHEDYERWIAERRLGA